MTVWELIALVRRRWLVVAFGMLATSLLAGYVLLIPGVYYSRMQVVLLPPPGEPQYNALIAGPYGLIGAAGAAAQVVGAPERGGVNVPGVALLTGVGATDGYSVRLPNIGGQWSVGYDGPNIDIQAVGPTPQKVTGYLDRAVADIRSTLEDWQRAQGVRPVMMIRTQLIPDTPAVSYSKGSMPRALAAVLILGLGVTLTVARAVDGFRKRRALSRSGAGTQRRTEAPGAGGPGADDPVAGGLGADPLLGRAARSVPFGVSVRGQSLGV